MAGNLVVRPEGCNPWTTRDPNRGHISHLGVTMPPFSSHLPQLLDVSCFRLLKQAYGRQIKDLIRMYINHVSKLKFFYTFYKAFFTLIIEKNIQGGFTGISLVPYNPERVLSTLDIKLRTLTPLYSRAGTL